MGPLFHWLEEDERPSWEEIAPHGAQVKAYWAQWQMLGLKDGYLVRKWVTPTGDVASWLIIVANKLKEVVMGHVHGTRTMGHLGVAKTLSKLRQRFH